MKTIYRLRGFMVRQTLSASVMTIAFVYGWWQIAIGAGGNATDLVFGVLFVGGSAWGFRLLLDETRDQVARIETDDDGATVVTLWRVTGPRRLCAAEPLAGWDYHFRVAGRGLKRRFLRVTHPDHPRPLEIEIRRDVEITDELRAMAGTALTELEAQAPGATS